MQIKMNLEHGFIRINNFFTKKKKETHNYHIILAETNALPPATLWHALPRCYQQNCSSLIPINKIINCNLAHIFGQYNAPCDSNNNEKAGGLL